MTQRRIAILAHERQRHVKRRYLVETYAEIWREDGHEVFTLFGVKEWVPADVVIVHVDLTDVPQEYLDFAARYPVVLNGKVRSIRKTSFSKQLLKRGDSYAGPVIVKSDLNFAGLPEMSLGLLQKPVFGGPTEYRVFPSFSDVPEPLFERSDLVVEKFLPECAEGLYHMRAMVFIGDRVSCTRMSSPTPIVNGATQVHVEDVEPHPEVLRLKNELGFDFGKFDYMIHDGEPILIDTNKTVGRPPNTTDATVVARRRHRAEGLYAYFL